MNFLHPNVFVPHEQKFQRLSANKYAVLLADYIEEIRVLDAKSHKIETVYIEKSAEIKTVTKTIIKKVPVYVSKPQKNEPPKAATESDAKNKAASLIRESDLIAYTHEVMARCNALVDWFLAGR